MATVRPVRSNNIEVEIKGLFTEAMAAAFPALGSNHPEPLVVPGRFSPFQCNNAMGLAKQLSALTPPIKMTPVDIGKALLQNIPPNDLLGPCDVTDQGFITLSISSTWLAATMDRTLAAGVTAPVVPKEKVLVDFSSPNIAKEMHVGHLRSTIIGECVCRLLEFVGHDVLRINHVGDWGTQFGMLILYMKVNFPDYLSVPPPISDLVVFYRAAKAMFDADPEFKEKARAEVVKLQALEDDSIKAWKLICDLSRAEFQEIYDRLHITLDERGESYYNSIIPSVLQMLREAGEIEGSDGAEIVVSKEVKELAKLDTKELARLLAYFVVSKRDGTLEFNAVLKAELVALGAIVTKEEDGLEYLVVGKESRALAAFDTQKDMDKLARAALPLFKPAATPAVAAELARLNLASGDASVKVPLYSFPLIARKSDGGYTYDTTDLAAAYHRYCVEKHERVIYITDIGQFEHFKMVLTVAQDMGWLGAGKRWAHAGFGLVSGEDGKKLKTRSGDTIKLRDLLDEACTRAHANLVAREKEQPQGFSEAEMTELARKIGIGAVKYFDLKQNRTTDYGFSFDKMLDFNGNTAVFLLYSYARICSIKRKAGIDLATIADVPIQITHDKERQLALAVLKFEPTILKTIDDLYPHHITDFCYELVGAFNGFFQECRVVGDAMQSSRLRLIEVVGTTLKRSLDLLGIEVADRL